MKRELETLLFMSMIPLALKMALVTKKSRRIASLA